MNTLLVLLLLVSLIAMIIGLVKPGLVIRWGEKKTRPRVLMVYGGLFIVLFIALGMTGTPNSEKTSSKAVTKTEEPQKSEQAQAEAASKEPEIKYTNEKARERVGDWCWEHQFPGDPKLSISKGSDSFYETDGKKYYLFTLEGLPRAVDILVDPYTGDLFFHDIGLKPQPLDKWYLEYKASHGNTNTKTQQNNVRIDEKSEWVEMPRGEMVSYLPVITGVVKNISNKPYSATITFTLFDGQGNQLGTAEASIEDLKPGNTWKFQAISTANTATFNLKGISYRLW